MPSAARNRPSGEMKRAHVLTGALSGCPEPTSQPNTAAVPGGLASTARPSGVKTSCVNPVSGTRCGGAGDRSGPACRQDPASQRRTRPSADAVARNFPSGENATRVIGPVWPISGEQASIRPAGSPGATVVAAAGRPTMVAVLAFRSTLPGCRATGAAGWPGTAVRPSIGHRRLVIPGRGRPLVRDDSRARRSLLRPAEVGDEVGQTRPVLRVFVQAGGEDVAQRPGQRRKVGRLAEDAADHRGKLVRVKRPVPGRGEHQHPAEGEEVTARRDLLAAQLLGCHVAVRADERVHRRQRAGVRGPGDAEVDDPRPVGAEDDVAGLEVPVDEPAGVNGGQPLGQRRRRARAPGPGRAGRSGRPPPTATARECRR